MHGKKLSEQVYEAANGMFVAKEDYIVDGIEIENLFEEGKECMDLYGKAVEAKFRLNERLHASEDKDVEIIIDSMYEIVHKMSIKMFEYGVVFGKREEK